ncbi:hypothetical protein ACP4OV_002104 [Aristida adscensionis]
MDVVAGAMGRLPDKLLELLKDEYKLQTGVKDQTRLLSRELESMYAALREVGQVPPELQKEQVRLWARDVREASYDMEDVLDVFLVRVEGAPKDPDKEEKKVRRLMKKMGNLFSLSKTTARHEIADAIKAISKQLEEVAKLRGRYTVDDIVVKPAASTSIDPRLLALYPKTSQLVGIDGPRDEVIQMLSVADGDVSGKEVKIVSIVGIGGLGKTTLAKAVYEKLTVSTPYKAFVPVGRNPDLKKVLRDILIDLDNERYTMRINLAILDERQLINELREFMKDKRYFIVIDDIWDASSWSTLRYVVNDNTLGSKIILTTRNRVVAEKVGHHSYNMKPLPHEISKILFFGRIFGSEEKCPTQFSEISERILKKCGGVPLAILTTSSLLATKSRHIKQRHEVHDSIGSGDGKSSDMDNMRKILWLSYYDLPSSLKSCLLYLSTFLEDCEIRKHRLILRWVAEEFVEPGAGDRTLFEVGEGYFNELLNRSLIQPASKSDEGIPRACRVHDIVLDLICSLSRDENFTTFTSGDNKEITHSSGSKVRRLSLYNTTWPIISMPKVRSLTIFSPPAITNDVISSLSFCHHLRVLDLEDCNLEKHDSLKFVGKLIHLRFLGLCHTRYKGELSAEIEKLQFLQTLDIVGTAIVELPSSIVRLKQLMFLWIDARTRLSNFLMNLTSLEWLKTAGVDSKYTAKALGHLTELRFLNVGLKGDNEGRLDGSLCKSLVESLGNLHKIQFPNIDSNVAVNLDGSVESLANLHTLMIYKTSSLPTWINGAFLPLLSDLLIPVDKVRWEDIQVLEMLPALRSLYIIVSGTSSIQVKERPAVSPDAFPCVTRCTFYGFATVPSKFPQGAMPMLESLDFHIHVEDFSNGDYDDWSMGHLPSLRQVLVRLASEVTVSREMVVKVEQALRHEADVHPNHPSFQCNPDWVQLEEEEEEEEEEEAQTAEDAGCSSASS